MSSSDTQEPRTWAPGLTRVPYWLYRDPAIHDAEQRRVFQGPTWNYLCLEAEIAEPGAYRTTFVGDMPVIVARDEDGELQAFENRCAHRGALIALDDGGKTRDFACVYHAWRYDLQGNLRGVAFQQGVNGKGGMPPEFRMEDHHPRKLRTASVAGMVFGSLDEDVPPIEEYLGDEILERIERVLCKPVEVIGRFKQTIPNNWKLYMENVKDSYHASLLHVFFTTFNLNRLSQKGGVIVSESGAHHVSYSKVAHQPQPNAEYSAEKLRSDKDGYALADPSMLDGCDEFGDGVTLQILSVFPGFVLAQIQNTLAVRQILPDGLDRTVLNWTYLGFQDDTPELRRMRLKQSNLTGPAGFVSMEDGAVGGFVQRGIAASRDQQAVLEMGGGGIETQENRTTEASVRGFWNAYRGYMEI
ncbi:MAG: Rieske (2Fe-2S) protein [Bordetella sp. SCN 67-23]|nr:aromatic ring-hydroxylating dioxygenase subunit alpha [Burkholderiales bacterium]ODS69754.1 MAG: Rieske (2Fe-2S) protein [Bordetella sp. SCN 67-23]ODU81327.1 MAG: Rieske (2Fe-2S) protein [Bordetella sp. SCN 68-11]OJW93868.1 MAG: Rieske (2Fe-2S) protein [Burkholderiales bacterium 67-32]